MKIGFDAKRIFQNTTGLGNYSRTLVSSLAGYYPEHEYFLFAPKITDLFDSSRYMNIHVQKPETFPSTFFGSAWRSSWVKNDLLKYGIDIYHGLSHEIPFGIQNTNVKSVVTIHDLIFERYPGQFNPVDVRMYRKKFTNACRNADRIIAISHQTKNDIINIYGIDEQKIDVCYQSCNPIFAKQIDEVEKQRVKELYNLPDKFFLSVGSIIERKNLLNVCKAMKKIAAEFRIPLVVIGKGDSYKMQVDRYIKENDLSADVIFLSETESAKASPSFKSAEDFPAIYQLSTAMVYPSVFEGFGLPVLEALWSRTPVITSNVSCLPEAGGDAALYVNPSNPEEIYLAMKKITENENVVNEMKEKGWQHAQHFSQKKCAEHVMNVYLSL